jgi:hypothetical protein
MNENIGTFNQVTHRIRACLCFEIEGYAAFIAVKLHETASHPSIPRRPRHSRQVTVRRFDFDDFSTQIRQQLGGVGANKYRRQINDFKASEGARHVQKLRVQVNTSGKCSNAARVWRTLETCSEFAVLS